MHTSQDIQQDLSADAIKTRWSIHPKQKALINVFRQKGDKALSDGDKSKSHAFYNAMHSLRHALNCGVYAHENATLVHDTNTGRVRKVGAITCQCCVCHSCKSRLANENRKILTAINNDMVSNGKEGVLLTFTSGGIYLIGVDKNGLPLVGRRQFVPLAEISSAVDDSFEALMRSRPVKRLFTELGFAGWAAVYEVTVSPENGFNPHYHAIAWFDSEALNENDFDGLARLNHTIKSKWVEVLGKRGFHAEYKVGADIRRDVDSNYLAKDADYDLTAEITSEHNKKSRGEGFTLWSLVGTYKPNDYSKLNQWKAFKIVELIDDLTDRKALRYSKELTKKYRDECLANYEAMESAKEVAEDKTIPVTLYVVDDDYGFSFVKKEFDEQQLNAAAQAGDYDQFLSVVYSLKVSAMQIDFNECSIDDFKATQRGYFERINNGMLAIPKKESVLDHEKTGFKLNGIDKINLIKDEDLQQYLSREDIYTPPSLAGALSKDYRKAKGKL